MSQNPNDQAVNDDNLEKEAAEHQSAQETDKLYAGKFKSVEDMEKSYLNLEKTFHAKGQERPQPKEEATTETEPLADVDKYVESRFDEFAKKRGLLSREEIKAEQYEKEQWELYLAQDKSAKEREELVKTLAATDKFKGKSFADVDAFVKGQLKLETKETKPRAMGRQSDESEELSDDDFRRAVGLAKGQRPNLLIKKSP